MKYNKESSLIIGGGGGVTFRKWGKFLEGRGDNVLKEGEGGRRTHT